jgi:hypothetical protein
MKIKMTMALAAAMASAGAAVPGRAVTVCLHRNANPLTLDQAQALASQMFGAAGVKIEWREPCHCPVGAILVSLSEYTPASDHPGALAYALPYEGTHIVVFYDRLHTYSVTDPYGLPTLLAHVLVHEITHILQGTDRHSETGVMKARWDQWDFARMRIKALPFTELDINLIQSGVDARRHNAALVGGNPAPAAAH